MKKKRTMDEYRQTKDSVYRKPPPKKMPRKSGIVMKETDSKDMPTSTIHHDLTPEELKEKMDTATSVKAPWIKKSEAKKEFGTPSSPKARHEESEWIPNPDLDRSHSKYSQMSKRELEILGRQYGVEVDRRLRKSTIIRIVESAEEMHMKEQALLQEPFQKKLLQGIFVGICIGIVIGALFGYAMGVR